MAPGLQDGISGNKQIFNATQKPSKSMDFSGMNLEDGQTGLPEQDDEILRQLNQMTQELLNEEKQSSLYLLKPQERVEQVECGSIHSLIRTSHNRLFSAGNGSTFALGHGNKETSKVFR